VHVVDLWVGGLSLSIEDYAHSLKLIRYPIHNEFLVSLAWGCSISSVTCICPSFSSLPYSYWHYNEVYYETQAVLCTSALL